MATITKYILSYEQMQFLLLVDKLYYDAECSFTHGYPKFVKSIIEQGEYNTYYIPYLNQIADTYRRWKKLQM